MSESPQNREPHVGVVDRVEADKAYVRFLRSKQCENCGGCMSAGEREMELQVDNLLGAEAGDRVRVELSPKRIVQASLMAYVAPLLLLILGVWLGGRISDVIGLLSGICACGAAFAVLHALEKRGAFKGRFEPRMTAIVTELTNEGHTADQAKP